MESRRHAVRFACSGLACAACVVALAVPASASAGTAPQFRALRGSVSETIDRSVGSFRARSMSVEVALRPSHNAALQRLLRALYNSKSASYHHFLAKGQFAARFAPSRAEVAAVERYLAHYGLRIRHSSSRFFVRASGSSALVEAAFHTSLRMYVDSRGVRYFQNSSAVRLPARLAGSVFGVIGLTDTIRTKSGAVVERGTVMHGLGKPGSGGGSSCETPYPSEQELANALLGISGFPFGYGGAPGCNGLTPSQTNSIYSAPNGKGAPLHGGGVTIAVFELSGYQQSDITTWAHQFYGSSYTPPLQDVNVDGGPLAPQCPAGDTCPPQFNGYAGDIEVDADIENQLAVAPDVAHLIVYNAPNDFTGQTELDEYTAIANADQAASISSSWALCENDAGSAYVQAENVVFEQMAMQGQSMFGAEGDTGAFSCIRSDGTTILNVLDPPAQPYVTSVGGTSFGNFNPGTNPNPSYPSGSEEIWNYLDLCNSGPGSDGLTGFQWCAGDGAGGGGYSQFWGRPSYQRGPGVDNSFTVDGNGSTQCSLASIGTPCREVPDVSANADEYTPYAEYCTGNANTPFSVCGTFSQFQNVPGWFGIGGTSLSSPLWSAIIADHDSLIHQRIGNANAYLYSLFNSGASRYFHDILAEGSNTHNGYFPVTPGYDMATGIGSPIMSKIITGG